MMSGEARPVANYQGASSVEAGRMPSNRPLPLTESEWREIIQLPLIRCSWGLDHDPDITLDAWREGVYVAKFDFVSGCPGYAGDLFVLMGDELMACPIVLIRDRSGKLTPARLVHWED